MPPKTVRSTRKTVALDISSATTWLAILLMALCPSLAIGGEIPFGSGVEITQIFDRGRSVIAGDLDGDGDLDVAGAAPGNSNEVAWWENTAGDGSAWTPRTVDDTLVAPVCVRSMDLDGDGDLDLVAANLGDATPNSSKLVAYLNLAGDGTTWSPITITDTLLSGADAVGFGDLDLDGDIDILGGAMSETDIYWFENTNGNATAWTEHLVSSTFNGARSMEAVDFDRDGDLDALTAGEFEDEVAWFENPGPADIGTALFWTRHVVNPATFDGAHAACSADFDHDGDLDVAAVADGTGANPEQVVWWENAGDDTTFTLAVIEGDFGRAHGIRCDDLDGDGDTDVFAAGRTEEPAPAGALTWWENLLDEGGTWAEHDVDEAFGGARNTWTADINGDGLLDTLGIGDNDKIIWYENLSIHRDAAFPVEESVDADHQGASDIAHGDIDGDGDGDLVASAATEGRVDWYSADGDGSWTQHSIVSSIVGVSGVAVGDVDHDGDPDVVVAIDGAIDDVLWYANTSGDGSTWSSANSIDSAFDGAKAVALGDIDGDGSLDVAAAAFDDEEFSFWANTAGDGTAWTETSISSAAAVTNNGAISVRIVDLDRDGDLDVIGAAETDDDMLFFSNTSGDGSTWTAIVVDGSADGINGVGAGDVDGDGDLDVFSANEVADTVTWWANTNGLGTTWSAAMTVDAFHNGALGIGSADFDADGDLDLVATRSKDGGGVAIYENNDGLGGSFTQRDVATAFDGAIALTVGDLDWNGEMDIAAVAFDDSDIAFFPNVGGQFALDTSNTSPVALGNSVTDDVLSIVASHEGLVAEQDGELTSFEILFEELEGDPLTSGEAEQVVENLFIYLDDPGGASPGAWDGADTLVTTVAVFSLDGAGVQSVPFVADDPNVRLVQGASKTYFVVLETTATYDSAGLTFLRLTHLTESSSTANDQTYDTPLRLQEDPNVSSNDFVVNDSGSTEADLVLVSISDSPDPVSPSSNLTYTVVVGNNGPWPAVNVTVDSTLPASTSFVSTNGCVEDPSGNPTCTLGSISPGGQKSFDITVAVSSEASGSLLYQAAADTDTTQISTGDENGSETTQIVAFGEIEVVQGSIFDLTNTADFAPGETVRYSIQVSNQGPGDDPTVNVTDTFPAEVQGVTWTCSASGGASCPASGSGNLNESVDLPDGSSVQFFATGTLSLAASGSISNTASAVGGDSNDSATQVIEVLDDSSDRLHIDGFESGNTADWAITTPPI